MTLCQALFDGTALWASMPERKNEGAYYVILLRVCYIRAIDAIKIIEYPGATIPRGGISWLAVHFLKK